MVDRSHNYPTVEQVARSIGRPFREGDVVKALMKQRPDQFNNHEEAHRVVGPWISGMLNRREIHISSPPDKKRFREYSFEPRKGPIQLTRATITIEIPANVESMVVMQNGCKYEVKRIQ